MMRMKLEINDRRKTGKFTDIKMHTLKTLVQKRTQPGKPKNTQQTNEHQTTK